jgi:tripartite-type tricarboxylate transporter receptor subunit TctC
MKFIHTLLFVLITSLLSVTPAVAEQKQPPLVFIVPYPPGGDTDIVTRMFATEYAEKTGRTTIVENKPGAAGVIGFMAIAKSANDGTVIGIAPSTLTTAPYFNPKAAKYDPKTDFTPILQITGHGMHIAVNSDSGIKNIRDLIEANKNGKVKAYGTPGVASPQNIFGEVFKQATGTDMIHVPFKGNAEVANSMLNNTIQLVFNTSLPVQALIDAGKVNVIASTGSKRSPTHPNVPTLAEQGIKEIELESWLGVIGPKDMDPKIVNELNAILLAIMKKPDVQEKLRKLSITPSGSSPSNFREKIHRDADRYQRLSKQLDIKIE